jgi:hypothetical protein
MGIFDSIKDLISGHAGDAVNNATGGLQDVAGDQLGGLGDSISSFGDMLGGAGESLNEEGETGAE